MEYLPPRNELESKLALLWQAILGVEQVGINDNFFGLGGHSIKATILASRIHKTFKLKISLREIFAKPTIREQADYLKRVTENVYESILPIGDGRVTPTDVTR